MIRRVHVWPPSKETPSNSPLTGPGSVDIATMFDGSVGLTAMASSASLPGRALMLTLAGCADAEPAGTMTASSVAATSSDTEREMIRDDLGMAASFERLIDGTAILPRTSGLAHLPHRLLHTAGPGVAVPGKD